MSVLHPPVRVVTAVKMVDNRTVVVLDCGHEVEYKVGSETTRRGVRCPYCPGVSVESASDVIAMMNDRKARGEKPRKASSGGSRVAKNIDAVLDENGAQVKQCSNCGETKPVKEYYAYPKSSDGFYHKCKTCYNQATSRVKRQEEAATKKAEKQAAKAEAQETLTDKPARRNGRKAKADAQETAEVVDGAGSEESQGAIAEELAGIEA